MNIEEWFQTKDYDTGVWIYASLPSSSKNIMARLQRGNTPKNRATLKYELTKFRKYPIKINVNPPVKKSPTPKPVVNQKEARIETAIVESNRKITMAMLPDPSLRKRFVEKNNAFYQYCELKYQLNQLPVEKENEALELILEIMKQNSFIDSVWREIDYYLENKKLLPKASDFTKLDYKQQCKKLQLLYQNRSKRKTTLSKWEKELAKVKDPKKKVSLKAKIDKKSAELQQIEIDIETLKKLTNV